MSEPPLGVAIPETRLHPIYLIIGTAKTLRQAIPFLVVTIFGGAPWWVNAVLFALVMAVAIAQWHVKKYSVVAGMLLLRSGLVEQSVRVVPVTKITALSAFQSLTQRLVGVWGLNVQSPGDRNGSAVAIECLSGSRLDELRAALESGGRTMAVPDPKPGPGSSTVQRYLAWRRTSVASTPAAGLQVIAVLTTVEMLIAAVTSSSILLILLAVLVVWFWFSEYLPIRISKFMTEIVEPQGVVAALITLVMVAIVTGVAFGALRLSRFTLIRDGDVLRNSRGLFSKRTATIPVKRVQAVRVVEGFWRVLLGYCSLQVEVAGIGRTNTSQRMLFPLVRTDPRGSLDPTGAARTALAGPALLGPPGACASPLSHSAARICRGCRPAAAVPARLVGTAGNSPVAAGLRSRRRAGPRGPVVGRRPVRGLTVEAITGPQHDNRASRWATTDRVVEFGVESKSGCRRVQNAVLLGAERRDPLHAGGGCAFAAAHCRASCPHALQRRGRHPVAAGPAN